MCGVATGSYRILVHEGPEEATLPSHKSLTDYMKVLTAFSRVPTCSGGVPHVLVGPAPPIILDVPIAGYAPFEEYSAHACTIVLSSFSCAGPSTAAIFVSAVLSFVGAPPACPGHTYAHEICSLHTVTKQQCARRFCSLNMFVPRQL